MALFKDYLITIAGRVAGAVAIFISLPMLFKHLGVNEYSLIAFASLVQGYANILDAGLSPSLAANVAKHRTSQERSIRIIAESTRYLVGKFFKYSPLLLGTLIATAYITLPNIPFDRVAFYCAILLLDAFASAGFRLQYSALQGLGDHAFANGIHTLNIVFRTTAAVGIAFHGGRVEYMYLAQVLITLSAISLSFKYYRVRRFLTLGTAAFDTTTLEGSVAKD